MRLADVGFYIKGQVWGFIRMESFIIYETFYFVEFLT